MFRKETKAEISHKVQEILNRYRDIEPELPPHGEIKFLLHVEGHMPYSWADIRNNEDASNDPFNLILNRRF